MGPYIQVATFCRSVTRDQDSGSLTVAGLVTDATIGLVGGPRTMPPMPFPPFPLVVTIWSGGTEGPRRVKIVPRDPQHRLLEPVYDDTVEFTDDPLSGVDLIMHLGMTLARRGRLRLRRSRLGD